MQERRALCCRMEMLEGWMHNFAHLGIVVLETIGVAVIVFAGLRGVYEYVRKKPRAQLKMASAMAFALEFKLGGEILRTLLVRELGEILIVACVIALRGVLNYMIHRDIHEQERIRECFEMKKDR